MLVTGDESGDSAQHLRAHSLLREAEQLSGRCGEVLGLGKPGLGGEKGDAGRECANGDNGRVQDTFLYGVCK